MHSPLKYHGGKHYMLSHIFDVQMRFKKHVVTRAEHFAGSAVWSLSQDPRGVSEIVNDTDQWLMAFWTCLRFDTEYQALQRVLEAVPFSEKVFKEAADSEGPLVQRAANFFIRARMSLAARMKSFAPPSTSRTRRGMNEQVSAWLGAVEGLKQVHDRVKLWYIMNGDFVDSIKAADSPQTMHYCDPPYFMPTRASKQVYRYEMTKKDHIRLLEAVNKCQGGVILSGYMSNLYKNRLRNWNCKAVEMPNHASGSKKKRRMTEILWYNF